MIQSLPLALPRPVTKMKIKTKMNTTASINENCQPKSVKALIPNCCPVIKKNAITIAITNINANTPLSTKLIIPAVSRLTCMCEVRNCNLGLNPHPIIWFVYLGFPLKYSPNTDLTASGIVSSFRAFRSLSRACTISSDIETIIFRIGIPLDTISKLYIGYGIYLMVGIGIWRTQIPQWRFAK